jgi:hypothetical protein
MPVDLLVVQADERVPWKAQGCLLSNALDVFVDGLMDEQVPSVHATAEMAYLTIPSGVPLESRVADLFARETMKRMDADVTGGLAVRRSFLALQRTGRFNYMPLNKPHFEERKQEVARFPGTDMSSYREWLEKNRLQDCLSNRVAHLENFPELRYRQDNT